MKQNNKRRRGDIVWAELGEHPGRHIQSGRRPCLIVNTSKSNAKVYTVMPGTCKDKKKDFPVHVKVMPKDVKGELGKPTVFMAEQLMTIDEEQVLIKAGYIESDSDVMKQINKSLKRQLELDETD